MDDRRFDALVKHLAIDVDRRSALKVLTTAGISSIAGTIGLRRTDAARRGFSGPTAPTAVPTQVPPAPTPTPIPPPPTPEPPLGCASGSTACGPDCCVDGTSMCCDSGCCVGYCYGEELCCPSPREYCAENNTCCAAGEKCCINGYCYSTAHGQCCQDFECPNGGKCCEDQTCHSGPNACCSDFDCPSGEICTENNTCCKTTCTPGHCTLDGCGRVCPCPDGYSCLMNGTCAKACDAGSLFCEEHFCGTCLVDADHANAYCGGDDRGAACDDTAQCPIGQFCTLLDPPSHCVTACRV